MKQLLQSQATGRLRLADVPAPVVEPGHLLVATSASLVSVGTERAVVELARKSILGKAKARPDLVKKLVRKATRDGVLAAFTAARTKLDQPTPLGYSCTGRVLAVGAGITGIGVGMRVACAGAGIANHAEVNLVPRNLCAAVPDGVTDESAAFVTVGAIVMQGIRQAGPTLGETFAVIGLGLLGQLAVQILRANGCAVLGIDVDADKAKLALRMGATAAIPRSGPVVQTALNLTRGRGVDGVIITAATDSNDPITLAGELCRDRGRVVAVGAVKMDVPRREFFGKEIVLLQSRSYGPGRYDPAYEERGHDYPIGYVRWTEQRNMEAFLDLCASQRMNLGGLITHRFPIERALDAFDLITSKSARPLGVILNYENTGLPERTIPVQPRTPSKVKSAAYAKRLGLGFVGAGAFASGVLLPALAKLENLDLRSIASARGFTAQHLAETYGFASCTTDISSMWSAPDIDAVVIATRHNLHAEQTAAGLRAGKHVFVEKPLALDAPSLTKVLAAQRDSNRVLTVGFNRRFAPLAREVQAFFSGRNAPLVMRYRVNAGAIPRDSWIVDPSTGGGRIVGEVCHFIDLLSFVANATPDEVFAQAIGATGAAIPDENLAISLKFSDGSIGSIDYVATGAEGAGKERLEILGAGRCAYLDDFRFLDLHHGDTHRVCRTLAQDKGHAAELKAFVEAARRGGEPPIAYASLAATTRATFAILRSLSSGKPVTV